MTFRSDPKKKTKKQENKHCHQHSGGPAHSPLRVITLPGIFPAQGRGTVGGWHVGPATLFPSLGEAGQPPPLVLIIPSLHEIERAVLAAHLQYSTSIATTVSCTNAMESNAPSLHASCKSGTAERSWKVMVVFQLNLCPARRVS